MATVNVYEQYFKAAGTFYGVPRRAALVMLTADSAEGRIRYEAAVTFFPHADDEDYAVSYDAFFSRVLYENKGRRSKKREQSLLQGLQEEVSALAAENGAAVFWNEPLQNARFG